MKKWKNQRVKEFFHFSTHTIARVRIYIYTYMHNDDASVRIVLRIELTCNKNVSAKNSKIYRT